VAVNELLKYQNKFLSDENMASFTPQGTCRTAKCLGTEFRRSSSLYHENPHDPLIKFSKNSMKVPSFMITLYFRKKALGRCQKKENLGTTAECALGFVTFI